MHKKLNLIPITLVGLFSVFFGYSLVFGAWDFFDTETKVYFQLSNNIYTDSLELRSTKVVFQSDLNLNNLKLDSTCNIYSKNISQKNDLYLFDIRVLDNTCRDRYVFLKNDTGEVIAQVKLNIKSEYRLLSGFLDYSTSKLEIFRNALDNRMLELWKYREYSKDLWIDYYSFLEKNRVFLEVEYTRNIINSILEWRVLKYSIPVEWKKLSAHYNKIPNSWRPYRASYTDGIHHGWDIDTKLWEQVVSLDDGIIVRVVSEFEFNDLNALTKTEDLSYEEELRNLDILRGKQVWLKTMKWDVVFYSHLDDVFTNIEEGVTVKRGQPLWTVGITGIPDKAYNDFHLHFPIHKNPFDEQLAGKYDYVDYMKWDWEFKWKTSDHILKHQYEVFEK